MLTFAYCLSIKLCKILRHNPFGFKVGFKWEAAGRSKVGAGFAKGSIQNMYNLPTNNFHNCCLSVTLTLKREILNTDCIMGVVDALINEHNCQDHDRDE